MSAHGGRNFEKSCLRHGIGNKTTWEVACLCLYVTPIHHTVLSMFLGHTTHEASHSVMHPPSNGASQFASCTHIAAISAGVGLLCSIVRLRGSGDLAPATRPLTQTNDSATREAASPLHVSPLSLHTPCQPLRAPQRTSSSPTIKSCALLPAHSAPCPAAVPRAVWRPGLVASPWSLHSRASSAPSRPPAPHTSRPSRPPSHSPPGRQTPATSTASIGQRWPQCDRQESSHPQTADASRDRPAAERQRRE
mmetsp:Transcript_1840/g.5079  ORF Transcript_1840/g.5079 Transcript_1840/m.5079 type:complete len:250 (-) Transcript_1840:908-1657(-)